MERRGNKAPKVDDVTSAAEETVQFDIVIRGDWL